MAYMDPRLSLRSMRTALVFSGISCPDFCFPTKSNGCFTSSAAQMRVPLAPFFWNEKHFTPLPARACRSKSISRQRFIKPLSLTSSTSPSSSSGRTKPTLSSGASAMPLTPAAVRPISETSAVLK